MKRAFILLMLGAMNPLASAEDTLLSSSSHGLSFLAPKGHWGTRLEFRTNSYDEIYDKNGKKFSLGSELSKVNLDAHIFPVLGAFGPSASLGQTFLSAEVSTKLTELTLGYGITDDLTFGVIIPYGKVSTKASFKITGGNVGFNPDFDATKPPSPTNFPLTPTSEVIPVV